MAIALDKTISEKRNWTDEEFMALPDGDRYELVNGELVIVGNSGMEHGNIGAFLCGLLEIYVRRNKLGSTFDSSTAFTMKTGNKRSRSECTTLSPDVSFVAKERLKGLKKLPKGFSRVRPISRLKLFLPATLLAKFIPKLWSISTAVPNWFG